nr:helix-turn-helix domain-containing protein [uncultured Ruminococcus sp.]
MISSNIRYLRNQEGLSQEAFAERFGVSRQSVAKWENGDSTPDIVKCREIADHYEISIDSLISLPLSEEQAELLKPNEGKYIFGVTKVGERGQIVIPKHAREIFDIKPGDRLMVMGDTNKGGIALAKVSMGALLGRK